MRRRLLRWLLYGLGALCLLGVLLGGALWWFFPAERVRHYLITSLETRLQRPVQLDAVQWYGLGFRLSGLRIADSVPQAAPLFSMDALQLQISLRQLLARRLVITRLVIQQPHLSLVERQGRWNLQDLLDGMTQTTTPAPPPTSAPTPPKPFALPAWPVALELSQLLLQDLRLDLQQANAQTLHLQGLSMRVSATLSQQASFLSAHVYSGSQPAVAQLAAPANQLQADLRLGVDLHLRQQALHTTSLSGSIRVTSPGVQLGSHTLPLDFELHPELAFNLPTQTLEVHPTILRLSADSSLTLQGQLTRVLSAPTLNLALQDGQLVLGQLQTFLTPWLPVMTLQGTVRLPHLRLQGPLAAAASLPLQLTGDLSFEHLGLQAPPWQLEIVDLQARLTEVQAAILAWQPQRLSGTLAVQLARATLPDLTLREAHNTVHVVLDYAAPEMTTLTGNLQIREVRYQHPRLGVFSASLHNTLELKGDIPHGNLTALTVTSQIGDWLHTTLNGSMRQFGREQFNLTHQATFQLAALPRLLPTELARQVGALEASGTVSLHSHLSGHIAGADQGILMAQSQLEVQSPRLRYGNLATLKNTTGTVKLSTVYTLPINVQQVDIQGQMTLQDGTVMPQTHVHDSALTFRLHLPPRASARASWQPQAEVSLRSAGVQQDPLALMVQAFSSDVRLNGQMAPTPLRRLLQIPVRQWLQQPRFQASVQWAQAQALHSVESGPAELHCQATATTSLRQSQAQVRLQATRVRYGPEKDRPPGTTLTLAMQTTQDMQRGIFTLRQLQLTAPTVLRLQAEGVLSDWGKNLRLALEVPDVQLRPLLARLPTAYRTGLAALPSQGQMSLKLMTAGPVPTLRAFQTQQAPRLDLEVRVRDVALPALPRGITAQGGNAVVHLRHQEDTLTLQGDMTLARLTVPEVPGNRPFTLHTTFDYALQAWRHLHIRTHQMQATDRGLTLALQGTVDSMQSLLAPKQPLNLYALLHTLEAHLMLTQVIDRPQTLRALTAGLPIQGTLRNTLSLTLQPGAAIQVAGELQVQALEITYPPLVQLSGLEGTVPYHKTLALDQNLQPASPPPGPAVPQPRTTAPRVLTEQLRPYALHRDNLIIDQLTIGHVKLSSTAFDIALQQQTLTMQQFQTHMLGGAVTGSLRVGQLDPPASGTGLHLRSEFAQINLGLLRPAQAGSTGKTGDISGNVTLQLTLPATATAPVDFNALSIMLNITQIGPQALERFLLFLDPLEQKPAIISQRRLLAYATPRLLTLRLQNSVLYVRTVLDTPLGQRIQDITPQPISALAAAGFPQISSFLQPLKRLTDILWPIVARGIRVDKQGNIGLY